MLGFTAATWEFLPGFCFAVPCRIACSGLCRMSDFGKESSKSMAEVSRLSALLEASGLAIQPSSIPSRLRRLEQISYVESRSVRDLDRLIPKFFICWEHVPVIKYIKSQWLHRRTFCPMILQLLFALRKAKRCTLTWKSGPKQRRLPRKVTCKNAKT